MSDARPTLSVVVPAFREAPYLANTFDALFGYLDARAMLRDTEVIVVTPDSPDETESIARRYIRRFPRNVHLYTGKKVGKGRDVRTGMLSATGEFVVFMDADLATPLSHLDPMLTALQQYDVVIGFRDLTKMHSGASRAFSSKLANVLVQELLLPGIWDSQCGFKGFRSRFVTPLFGPLSTKRWGFDIEVLVRARKLGCSIHQLPIFDWNDPKGSKGLAGEVQWAARFRTLHELIMLRMRFGAPSKS